MVKAEVGCRNRLPADQTALFLLFSELVLSLAGNGKMREFVLDSWTSVGRLPKFRQCFLSGLRLGGPFCRAFCSRSASFPGVGKGQVGKCVFNARLRHGQIITIGKVEKARAGVGKWLNPGSPFPFREERARRLPLERLESETRIVGCRLQQKKSGGIVYLRAESSVVSPIALASMPLEASMGPMSNSGRITGHGNLADARAKCRSAGNAIAVSQRIVLVLRSLLFSDFVIVCWFGRVVGSCGRCRLSVCLRQSRPHKQKVNRGGACSP